MILNDLPLIMLRCLTFTCLIEVIIASFFKINTKELITVALVNIMTNPLAVSIPVYFNIEYGIRKRNIALIVMELFALITEALIYKKYEIGNDKINPFVLSLLLNFSSYTVGEIINHLIY